MLAKPMADKINEGFPKDIADEFGQKYLEMLYANWSEMVRTLRRTILFSVVLMTGFLLLDHAKAAEIALGPLKTTNIAAVLTLIPAVTSFLLFEAIDLTIAGGYYGDAASALMKKLYPSVYENDLEMLLEPTTTFAWGIGFTAGIMPRPEGKLGKFRAGTALGIAFAVVGGVLAFLVYAYAVLYGSSHANVFAVTASLVFAAFNVARACIEIFVALAES
jgi:hypothetical protein